MCRVRNTHTAAPWTTAYICITIDDSCLDENGRFVDKPMTVRMVQWQPYCVKKPFDAKTPVCAACKRTNRTRSFCRERHKHRQLPWCSVYVLLSTLEAADPSTIVAGASKKVEADEGSAGDGRDTPKEASPPDDTKEKAEEASTTEDTIASDAGDTGDDINEIAESRTFLAKVSTRASSIHWLEMADFDASETAPFPGSIQPDQQQQYPPAMVGHPMDPNQPPQYYHQPNMNYAAQQHQNALKTRQQYFFQMQQQHHQQYPPGPPPPQGHWQQPPYSHHMGPGQGEPNHAGTAAGEQQRDAQQQPAPPPNHPHWAAMYYQPPPGYGPPPPPLPPQDANGQMPMQPGMVQPGMEQAGGEEVRIGGAAAAEDEEPEQYHTPPESTNGDGDEPDSKRQRV